jgi:ribosome biogenesis GTPase A
VKALNWFPGHMNKARREIRKAMKEVDFVIEVLDARIPFSSENPLVTELRGERPSLKILNKSDLADPEVTDAWVAHLERGAGVKAIPLHLEQVKRARGLIDLGVSALPAERNMSRPVTAMILGVPNVGKSTLINTLAGRTLARTGNVPALTRKQQRVYLNPQRILLDTPGFLWPRLHPPECGYRLAVTGAISEAVLDFVEIARFAAAFLLQDYPEALTSRYKLKALPADADAALEAIAARRGCLGRGGVVDLHKVAEILLRELRAGKLGRLSLERPPAA